MNFVSQKTLHELQLKQLFKTIFIISVIVMNMFQYVLSTVKKSEKN